MTDDRGVPSSTLGLTINDMPRGAGRRVGTTRPYGLELGR
jgi:hypothetical protein